MQPLLDWLSLTHQHTRTHTHTGCAFLQSTIYFLLSLRGQTSTLPSPALGPCGAVVGKYLVLQLLCCHAERDNVDHFCVRWVLQSELAAVPMTPSVQPGGCRAELTAHGWCRCSLTVPPTLAAVVAGGKVPCSRAAVKSSDLSQFSGSVSSLAGSLGIFTPPSVRNLWILGVSSLTMSLSHVKSDSQQEEEEMRFIHQRKSLKHNSA